MGESSDDFVGSVLDGFREGLSEFVGEGLDAEDEDSGSDVVFEVFEKEGEGELVGGEGDTTNRVFINEFNGASFSLHEGSIDEEDEMGVGVDDMTEEVFRNRAGIDEFHMGWIATLELVNDVGADAIVSFEVVSDAEDGDFGCVGEGFCKTVLPGYHQVRKTGRMLYSFASCRFK